MHFSRFLLSKLISLWGVTRSDPLPAAGEGVESASTDSSTWRRRAILTLAFCLFASASYSYLTFLQRYKESSIRTFTNFHQQQADAFLHGQLHLRTEPHPALLAAANPFNPALSGYWQWDTVFFDGKYYIYWGPFPALLLAVVNTLGLSSVPDQYPTLFFSFLRLFFGAGIIFGLWRHCRPSLPAWAFAIACVALAWSHPIPRMMRRPAAYEAAILGAQAMFVTGIYFGMRAILDGNRRYRWPALCGFAYGAAVACRASILPAALVMVGASAFLCMRSALPKSLRNKQLLALIVPFVGIGIALAAFNHLRFGSPFESGQRYIFTVTMPDPAFHWKYVLGNIYNYLYRPLTLPGSSAVTYARGAYVESTVGLIPVAPFLVVFALLALPTVKRTFQWLFSLKRIETDRQNVTLFALVVIGGAALAFGGLAPVLFYFAATKRYAADFSTGMTLLSYIGLIGVVEWCGDRPFRRYAFAGSAAALAAYTALAGVYHWVFLRWLK